MNQLVLMKIAPWPTGRMLAILYLVLGIFFTPFFLIYSLSPEAGEYRALSLVVAIFMPLIYALMGLFFGMIGAVLYNVFARMFGGIPLGFDPASSAVAPGWVQAALDKRLPTCYKPMFSRSFRVCRAMKRPWPHGRPTPR